MKIVIGPARGAGGVPCGGLGAPAEPLPGAPLPRAPVWDPGLLPDAAAGASSVGAVEGSVPDDPSPLEEGPALVPFAAGAAAAAGIVAGVSVVAGAAGAALLALLLAPGAASEPWSKPQPSSTEKKTVAPVSDALRRQSQCCIAR